MKKTYEVIFQDTLHLLQELAGDWEYSDHIDRDSYFLADLGFESLDVVILSAQVQEEYNQTMPFTEFFQEIGEREVKDVTVREWVDFIYVHLNGLAEPSSPEQVS